MLRRVEVARADLSRRSSFYFEFFFGGGLVRYSILINKCLTCPFEVRRKCPGNNDKRKQSRQCVPLLPTLPAFHLMSPAAPAAESQSRVGGLTTLPSLLLLSSARSLLSDSPLFYLSSLFLDPPPPPARCHRVPVLSGCLRFLSLSLAWQLTFLGSRVRLVLVPPPLWNCLICLELCRDSQGFCAILKKYVSPLQFQHFTINQFLYIYKLLYSNLKGRQRAENGPLTKANPVFTNTICPQVTSRVHLTFICPWRLCFIQKKRKNNLL